MIGRTVGPYRILDKLGEGGMGEVYRATDTNLGREVAIKVLPASLAADPDRLARFDREARTLAALNHPNIAQIYGLEKSASTGAGQPAMTALVMELVEGPTLADRIAQGPIPVDDALPIAKQIAEALEAAHEQGIVHRDLKPANIKIQGAWGPTPTRSKTAPSSVDSRPRVTDGTVKVLDFGLAKAMEPGSGSVRLQPDLTASPTITSPAHLREGYGGQAMTGAGVILGTAAYMSPEQARGHRVDARTDVWAFGCVLYEMLTGWPAFPGASVTDVLAAVVRAEPDWARLPEDADPRLRELVARCLEKTPRQRWHAIGDVRVEIERIQSSAHLPRVDAGIAARAGLRGALGWGTTVVAAGLLATAAILWTRQPADTLQRRTVRFSFDVPSGANQGIWSGVGARVAISPDGARIAYLATRSLGDDGGDPVRQIFIRAVADATGTPVPGTEGAVDLFFSPDSAWIGFVAGGWIRKVPVAGGAPLEIAPRSASFQGGADWGPGDTVVFTGGITAGLMRVSAVGGTPELLTAPDPEKGEISHGRPEILPDGSTVLFAVATQEGSRIARVSLDTGERQDLGLAGSNPRHVQPGYLAHSQGGNLRLVAFDLETMQPRGPVQPAQGGIEAASFAGLEIASFDVSRTGDLVFVPGSLDFRTEPVWVDRSGNRTPIETAPGLYLGPVIAPDGTRFAIVRTDALGIGKLWVMNLDGSQPFPVSGGGAEYNAAWRPDGATLTFTSDGNLFEKRVDEDGEPVELLRRENYQVSRSWSPDGKLLAFREISRGVERLWVFSRGGEPEPLTGASSNASAANFAPQGGWIAYVSDETGQNEVYVRRYPGTARAEAVSRGGGREPVWSRDGRELFYRSGNRMMAVTIQTAPLLEIGEAVELWSHPYFSQEEGFLTYDVAADGRFLMLAIPRVEELATMRVNVVLDWLAEAEARLRGRE